MSPPHIPKIGATTVPAATAARSGGHEASAQRQKPEAQAAQQTVERAVVANRSLEMLETMAGRVSQATGESMDVSRPAEAGGSDGYRVQLMSFIVGSLSRASQAFRQQAVPTQEEPPAEEPEQAEDEPEVEAALPEQAVQDPVQEATEPPPVEAVDPAPQTTAYGAQGQAMTEKPAEGKVETWA